MFPSLLAQTMIKDAGQLHFQTIFVLADMETKSWQGKSSHFL